MQFENFPICLCSYKNNTLKMITFKNKTTRARVNLEANEDDGTPFLNQYDQWRIQSLSDAGIQVYN